MNPSDSLTSLTTESFLLSILFLGIGTIQGTRIELFNPNYSAIWFTGLVTFFPAYYYSRGAKKVRISSLGMMGLLRPIIRFLVAILALRETLSLNQTLSIFFIFLSLCSYFIDYTNLFQIGKNF